MPWCKKKGPDGAAGSSKTLPSVFPSLAGSKAVSGSLLRPSKKTSTSSNASNVSTVSVTDEPRGGFVLRSHSQLLFELGDNEIFLRKVGHCKGLAHLGFCFDASQYFCDPRKSKCISGASGINRLTAGCWFEPRTQRDFQIGKLQTK